MAIALGIADQLELPMVQVFGPMLAMLLGKAPPAAGFCSAAARTWPRGLDPLGGTHHRDHSESDCRGGRLLHSGQQPKASKLPVTIRINRRARTQLIL